MPDTRFRSPHGEYPPLYDSLKGQVSYLVGQIELLAARVARLEERDAEKERLLGSLGIRGSQGESTPAGLPSAAELLPLSDETSQED